MGEPGFVKGVGHLQFCNNGFFAERISILNRFVGFNRLFPVAPFKLLIALNHEPRRAFLFLQIIFQIASSASRISSTLATGSGA